MDDFSLSIVSIEERYFSFHRLHLLQAFALDTNAILYNSSYVIGVNREAEQIRVTIDVTAVYTKELPNIPEIQGHSASTLPLEPSTQKPLLLQFEGAVAYKVSPIHQLVSGEGYEQKIAPQLLSLLTSETNATVRGILYSHTRGSYLEGIPLGFQDIDFDAL